MSPTDPQAARDFLHAQITVNTAALTAALATASADGFASASSALTETGADFWDTWKPGDAAVSDLLDNGGFASLLDSQGIAINGIAGTTLDRMGTALAAGAARGDSVEVIAAALGDIVDDPSRAYQIADTELARAMGTAAQDVMRENGLDTWDWLISDGACEECQAEEDANPHSMDDDPPPLHPGCRCAASPRSSLPLDGGDAVDSASVE